MDKLFTKTYLIPLLQFVFFRTHFLVQFWNSYTQDYFEYFLQDLKIQLNLFILFYFIIIL